MSSTNKGANASAGRGPSMKREISESLLKFQSNSGVQALPNETRDTLVQFISGLPDVKWFVTNSGSEHGAEGWKVAYCNNWIAAFTKAPSIVYYDAGHRVLSFHSSKLVGMLRGGDTKYRLLWDKMCEIAHAAGCEYTLDAVRDAAARVAYSAANSSLQLQMEDALRKTQASFPTWMDAQITVNDVLNNAAGDAVLHAGLLMLRTLHLEVPEHLTHAVERHWNAWEKGYLPEGNYKTKGKLHVYAVRPENTKN